VPPRGWRVRVEDILVAVERISAYTAGMTFEGFRADAKTVDAVLYNIGIIGEAARHVPLEIEERFPEVPWAKMRAIRNVVTHQYAEVSPAIIWRTVQQNLPTLEPQLRRILKTEE
jgi:uncharacterized protein with HEPN domain